MMNNKDKIKHYMVDDIIISTNKDMTGFKEVPSELAENNKPCDVLVELWKKSKECKHENKCCKNCIHSIKDNPNYFCFYYRKYIWNENEIPSWCNKYKESKK